MPKTEIQLDSTKVKKINPEPIGNTTESAGRGKSFMQKVPWILMALVVLAAAIFFGIQYKKVQDLNKQVSDLKSNPNKAAQDELNDTINQVGKLMVLPKDETPTLATVTDLGALKDQPFFATAEVGDKVLIYTNAKKAILYSPSLDKIKEVAPVNLGDTTDTSANANTNTATSKTGTTAKTNSNANKPAANSSANSNANSNQ